MNNTKKKTQSKSEIEKEKLSFAQHLVEKAKKDKLDDHVMDRYKRSIRYFKGNHLIKNRSKDKGNHVFNKFAEIFSNKIAHIVSQIPRWKYRPTTEQAVFTSDMLNHFLRDILWEKDGWFEKAEECLNMGAHAGTDWIFTDVDDEGWPTFPHVPIGAVLYDRQKHFKDLRYIIRVIKKGVSEIKEEFGKEVLPETEMELEFNAENKSYEVTASQPYKGPVIKNLYGSAEWATDLLGQALIYEIWMEDKTKESIPFDKKEVDAEHNVILGAGQISYIEWPRFTEKEAPVSIHKHQNHIEHIIAHTEFLSTLDPREPFYRLLESHIAEHQQFPLKEKREKFPFGKIMMYCQNDWLGEKPNTMPINWRERWIKWNWEDIPDELIGKNLGHDLFDPQDAFNHRKNSIMQNINLMNNGVMKVARGAYNLLKSNLSKFTNRIGSIIEVTHKDDVTIDYGQGLPPSTFNDMTHTEMFMNGVGQNRDVAQGNLPAAGTPNSALETLLGEYYKSIGGGVRHFAIALQKIARNASIVMKEYLPEDTIIALSDKKDIVEKEWREIKSFINEENIIIDMNSFNISTRQERVKEAVEFYREGIFPLRKHVLMYLDNPDKWQIIAEGDELDALKQQVQVMAEELDNADKEINTMRNRLQSNQGEGNVGNSKTSE